jgi:NitT/TauT family transport system substrate-binding protein
LENKLNFLTRRQFMTALSGLVLAKALPACSWIADKPISIAAHVWPGYESIFLARSEGWLDSNQIILIETKSASESLRKLSEGKVLGAALTLDEVLKARALGLSLSIAMVFDISAGADMLVVKPNIKKLADLKGARIGYEKNAVGELLLNKILKIAELKNQDVKLIELTIDEQLQAWKRSQVDAVVTYEPIASQLQELSGIKLFDSRQIPNTIVDVLAMRNDAIDFSHASAIRHLISAHFHAIDHLKRNPQDAAYRMSAHLGLPVVDVLPAFKGLVLPDAAYNYRLLVGSPPELLNSARKLSNDMFINKLLKHEDSLSTLINADFLPTDFS